MTLPLTSSIPTLVDQVVSHLRSNIGDLGVHRKEDVYYGAQDRYPRYPSIAVESGPEESPLYQVGLQQENQFTLFILCIYAQVGSESDLRRETDLFAERVITTLHSNRKMDGLVIHGHVVRKEPGFTLPRSGVLSASTRLRWVATSRSRVGS